MISAIIPFRDWPLDRLERCIASLRDKPSITEILIIDFGSERPLGGMPGARVVRVEADLWCLSEANNIGICEAQNDIVMKVDADVVLNISDRQASDMAKGLASGKAAFTVLQPTDFTLRDGKPTQKRLRPSWAEGCVGMFNRADVIEIGGYDTRFHGYGGEDNDLCQRLRRYGKRVDLFSSDLVLHERHPPSPPRAQGQFTAARKEALLAEGTIFRPEPFRHSDYRKPGVFGPAITVAIATTARENRDAQLAFCLSGLARQSFDDFEVLICENGSPSEARLDIDALRAAFPTLTLRGLMQETASIPKARNQITDAARGFYIAVHDDDDVSLPDRFAEQLACLAAHDAVHGCHSGWIEFDEISGRLTSYTGQPRHIGELHRRPGKITLHSTALYRRDVLQRMRYDETLTLGSDHQLQVRMTLAGLDIPHSGRFHCLKRLHGASVTSTGPDIQRDVADRTNGAYRYFLGEPYLAAVRARDSDPIWVTGLPTMREMLGHLPPDFGAFHFDLDVEAALELGFDPLFTSGEAAEFMGLSFTPAYQGLGNDTRLVLRSEPALSAGEAARLLPALAHLRGLDIVSAAELSIPRAQVGLDALQVDKGQRAVISRRFDDMAQALAALPAPLLSAAQGHLDFFAVNTPDEGVHVQLGHFDSLADLEYALNVANAGAQGDFIAVTNQGKPGSFYGN